MCSRQRSQVSWTASSTSSAHSPHRRASHRSSGSYCSLIARHADSSPARIPATSSSGLQAGTSLAVFPDFIVVPPVNPLGFARLLGPAPEPQPASELRRARRGYRACLSCGMVRQWALSADSPLTPGGRRAMRIRILGPFHVEDGGQQITIGGVRQRAVLADLLLRANEVVPSEQILVDLWGGDVPPSAANALQAAVSRLRRVLPPSRLTTTGPGYMLRIFPAEVDAVQFEQLIFEGRGGGCATARPGDDALAWPAAGRLSLRTVRAGRDRQAGGAAAGLPGRTERGATGSGLAGRTHGRAGPDGQRSSPQGAPSRPAHARPLSQRTADRGPRGLPGVPESPHGRPGAGTVVG